MIQELGRFQTEDLGSSLPIARGLLSFLRLELNNFQKPNSQNQTDEVCRYERESMVE